MTEKDKTTKQPDEADDDQLQKPRLPTKKPRTQAQIEAFEKAKERRLQSLEVKRNQIKEKQEEIAAIKKTKPLTKAGEKLSKQEPKPKEEPKTVKTEPEKEESEEEEEQIVIVKRPRPRKKKIIVYQDEESDDDEPVVKNTKPNPLLEKAGNAKRATVTPVIPEYRIKFV